MRIVRASACAAVLMLALLGPACSLFHRSAKAKVPPAPLPAPAAPVSQPAPRAPKSPEVMNPAPPDIQPQPPAVQPPPVEPQKIPPPPRRRSRVPAPAPAPAVETVPAPQPPPPPPQLEQILTPQQQKAYNEEIDRNISRAQRTLAALGGRRLDGEQQTYLERIRAFLKQADEARRTDLFRAKNLAERASLLADDLLRSAQ
jgi:outer membrane biosynthesis protein TonB